MIRIFERKIERNVSTNRYLSHKERYLQITVYFLFIPVFTKRKIIGDNL